MNYVFVLVFKILSLSELWPEHLDVYHWPTQFTIYNPTYLSHYRLNYWCLPIWEEISLVATLLMSNPSVVSTVRRHSSMKGKDLVMYETVRFIRFALWIFLKDRNHFPSHLIKDSTPWMPGISSLPLWWKFSKTEKGGCFMCILIQDA